MLAPGGAGSCRRILSLALRMLSYLAFLMCQALGASDECQAGGGDAPACAAAAPAGAGTPPEKVPPGPRTLTLGASAFADRELYDSFTLSAAQRAEYFTYGVTVLRGVLRPGVVWDLRQVIHSNLYVWNHYNMWMDSAALTDFYLYSNLASVVAQLFDSPNTETESVAGTIHLWKDFMRLRPPANLAPTFVNTWHADFSECDGDLPANYTRRALPRLMIPLEDNMPAPLVINQRSYVGGMPSDEAADYFAGRLPYRATWKCEFWNPSGLEDAGCSSEPLPVLPRLRLSPSNATVEPANLRLGDVVIMNTCAWHKTPPLDESRWLPTLQPTFAHGSTALFEGASKMYWGNDHCKHSLAVGDRVEKDVSCFPRALPETPRGTQITIERLLLSEEDYALARGRVIKQIMETQW